MYKNCSLKHKNDTILMQYEIVSSYEFWFVTSRKQMFFFCTQRGVHTYRKKEMGRGGERNPLLCVCVCTQTNLDLLLSETSSNQTCHPKNIKFLRNFNENNATECRCLYCTEKDTGSTSKRCIQKRK